MRRKRRRSDLNEDFNRRTKTGQTLQISQTSQINLIQINRAKIKRIQCVQIVENLVILLQTVLILSDATIVANLDIG